MDNYFPTVLAVGSSFCNREAELKHLLYNVDTMTHTLLMSPRRYGKTSLALRVLERAHQPYAHIDLYKAMSDHEIANLILQGVAEVLSKIESKTNKLMKMAASFFSSFDLKLAFSGSKASIEITRKAKNPTALILSALEHLDEFVLEHSPSKAAVIFLDECQVMGEVVKNRSIEAVIREAMQKAKGLRYFFAGSNRHLIGQMFNDDSRPFFNSCDQIALKRIDREAYKKHIDKASKERWQAFFTEVELEVIFDKTQCHPYYINKLCSMLFRHDVKPSREDIVKVWNDYCDENKSRVQQELALLSLNPRRVLMQLVHDRVRISPFSSEVIHHFGMPPASVHRAMTFLLNNDYVYINEHHEYCILDPLIASVLGGLLES